MRPPTHLDAVAAAKWKELCKLVDVVQPGTADALAAYCVAFSRWVTAEGEVAKLGLIVKSSTGTPVENPFLGIIKRAMVEMNRWGKELGIVSKSAKSKVPKGAAKSEAPEAPADDDQELARLLEADALRRGSRGRDGWTYQSTTEAVPTQGKRSYATSFGANGMIAASPTGTCLICHQEPGKGLWSLCPACRRRLQDASVRRLARLAPGCCIACREPRRSPPVPGEIYCRRCRERFSR